MDPQAVVTFVMQHKEAAIAVAVLWIFSNVVTALPSPDQSSGKGYKFFFTFMHSVAGGLPRFLPSLRLPGDPTRSNQTFFGKPPESKE